MVKNSEKNEKIVEGTPPRLPFSLRLRTSKSSKNTMSRIGRSYAKGEIDETVFKNMVWFMSMYLNYLKQDDNIDLLCRIEAIERILAKPKENKKELKLC